MQAQNRDDYTNASERPSPSRNHWVEQHLKTFSVKRLRGRKRAPVRKGKCKRRVQKVQQMKKYCVNFRSRIYISVCDRQSPGVFPHFSSIQSSSLFQKPRSLRSTLSNLCELFHIELVKRQTCTSITRQHSLSFICYDKSRFQKLSR